MSAPDGTSTADVLTGSDTRGRLPPGGELAAAAPDRAGDVAEGAGVAAGFPPEHPARNPTAVTVPTPSVVRIARRDGPSDSSPWVTVVPSAAFTALPPGPRRDGRG